MKAPSASRISSIPLVLLLTIILSSVPVFNHTFSSDPSLVTYSRFPAIVSFQNSFACSYSEPSQTYLIRGSSANLCLKFYNNSTQTLTLDNFSLLIGSSLVATNIVDIPFPSNSSVFPNISFNLTTSTQLGEQQYKIDSNNTVLLLSGFIEIALTPPATNQTTVVTTAVSSSQAGPTTMVTTPSTTIATSTTRLSSSSSSSSTSTPVAVSRFPLDTWFLIAIVVVIAATVGAIIALRKKS